MFLAIEDLLYHFIMSDFKLQTVVTKSKSRDKINLSEISIIRLKSNFSDIN